MLPFLLASGDGDPIGFAFHHALNRAAWPGAPLSKFQVMVALSALVVLALGFLANKTALVPRGFLRNALESLMLYVRDDLVRPTMGGHHGDRYVPFFCTIFLFILVMNLLGIVPIPLVGGTATSNLMTTGALAAIVLLVSLGSGLAFHRSHFLHLFVPSGLPKVLVPVLFVLEVVGFLVKHAVLMVRLFANMIAGHLVLGAFLALIFLFKSYWVAGLLSVPLALFVSGLELLVAFLQAYVFTLLSALFIGGMVHPEH